MFFVLDQVDGAVFAEELDALEPEVVVGIFFSVIGDEEVAGAFGEEELVGLVVDFLAAEVPDMDLVGVSVGADEFPVEDVDTFGGGVFGGGFEGVVGIEEFVGETGFSGAAFADEEKFGFVEGLGLIGVAGGELIVENSFWAGNLTIIIYANNFRWNTDRITTKTKFFQFG